MGVENLQIWVQSEIGGERDPRKKDQKMRISSKRSFGFWDFELKLSWIITKINRRELWEWGVQQPRQAGTPFMVNSVEPFFYFIFTKYSLHLFIFIFFWQLSLHSCLEYLKFMISFSFYKHIINVLNIIVENYCIFYCSLTSNLTVMRPEVYGVILWSKNLVFIYFFLKLL